MRLRNEYLLITMLLFLSGGSYAQKVRPAARADQFYPGNKNELNAALDGYLENAEKTEVSGEVVGLWVPHAGYMFSAQVAANAFRLLSPGYESVVIIGPAHTEYVKGASIDEFEYYETPLGNVRIDTEMVKRIREQTPLVTCVPGAHILEHSVEVQIPFIQKLLPNVPIVPILVGSLSYQQANELAQALDRAAGNRKVLFIASSDMSHYPSYKNAYDVDRQVIEAVAAFHTKDIWRLNSDLMKQGIPNLQCVMCGTNILITVMMTSERRKATSVAVLPYANSGDISGERNSVVGYGAAAFYRKTERTDTGGKNMTEEIRFSPEETAHLFQIARESITQALQRKQAPEFDVRSENLNRKRGVFVTLTNHGRLRGCIGYFDPAYPLYEIVSRMAVAAATEDYRFLGNPVTLKEMDAIQIKISVLSELKKVSSIEEIEVGKHGIWIKQGSRGGTYLPEVATDMGWNRIEFLEHCCVEKAGLSKDAWKKDADIYIYSSQILSEDR